MGVVSHRLPSGCLFPLTRRTACCHQVTITVRGHRPAKSENARLGSKATEHKGWPAPVRTRETPPSDRLETGWHTVRRSTPATAASLRASRTTALSRTGRTRFHRLATTRPGLRRWPTATPPSRCRRRAARRSPGLILVGIGKRCVSHQASRGDWRSPLPPRRVVWGPRDGSANRSTTRRRASPPFENRLWKSGSRPSRCPALA